MRRTLQGRGTSTGAARPAPGHPPLQCPPSAGSTAFPPHVPPATCFPAHSTQLLRHNCIKHAPGTEGVHELLRIDASHGAFPLRWVSASSLGQHVAGPRLLCRWRMPSSLYCSRHRQMSCQRMRSALSAQPIVVMQKSDSLGTHCTCAAQRLNIEPQQHCTTIFRQATQLGASQLSAPSQRSNLKDSPRSDVFWQ